MPILNTKILITIGLILCSLTAISQKTGKLTFGKDSTDMFRGFGVGLEYFSGHKELSKIFTFKRNPKEEYKIGKAVYITYFNLNQSKKAHYYADAGVVFWNEQKLDVDSTLKQRSEILQFTGSYTVGGFGIIARIGGLLNHNTFNGVGSTTKNNNFDVTTGLGLSIPIPFPKTKGLNFTILISRVNKHYTWSGTIFIL